MTVISPYIALIRYQTAHNKHLMRRPHGLTGELYSSPLRAKHGGGGGGGILFLFILELPIPDNPCAKLCHVFNSLTLGDPYTHQRAGPASVKIHRNRVTHICVSKLTIIGADQASSNYLIRYWNIVDWTIKNKHFHSRKFISKCRVRSGVRFFRCLYIKILTCLFSTKSLSAVSLHVNHTLEDNVVEILIKVFFQIKIIIQ